MTFLLDTNVISDLRRPERSPKLQEWTQKQATDEFFCSCVSILEIEIGVLRAVRRDARKAGVLRRWIDDKVLPRFLGQIIPIDTEIALRCAALHVPDPRPERDAWIAATALVHRMAVVTRNVRDFAPMGVRVINPWDDND